jgi:hypothetical protein
MIKIGHAHNHNFILLKRRRSTHSFQDSYIAREVLSLSLSLFFKLLYSSGCGLLNSYIARDAVKTRRLEWS